MKKYWRHIIIGLVTGMLNGLFGAGGGLMLRSAVNGLHNEKRPKGRRISSEKSSRPIFE